MLPYDCWCLTALRGPPHKVVLNLTKLACVTPLTKLPPPPGPRPWGKGAKEEEKEGEEEAEAHFR